MCSPQRGKPTLAGYWNAKADSRRRKGSSPPRAPRMLSGRTGPSPRRAPVGPTESGPRTGSHREFLVPRISHASGAFPGSCGRGSAPSERTARERPQRSPKGERGAARTLRIPKSSNCGAELARSDQPTSLTTARRAFLRDTFTGSERDGKTVPSLQSQAKVLSRASTS